MPAAPYLLFGFDVDRNDPNAAAILRDVESRFPISTGVGPTGVANTYLVELPASQAPAVYRRVANYLYDCDRAVGGRLNWFVQLCRTPEYAPQ